MRIKHKKKLNFEAGKKYNMLCILDHYRVGCKFMESGKNYNVKCMENPPWDPRDPFVFWVDFGGGNSALFTAVELVRHFDVNCETYNNENTTYNK